MTTNEKGNGIDWSKILPNIFTDRRFRELRWNCWYGEVDGAKVGVVFATRNIAEYNTFALNKPELDRLRVGIETKRLDHAFVMAVNLNGPDRDYCGWATLKDIDHKIDLHRLRPRDGKFGDFYSLPPGTIDDPDVPF